MRLPLDRFTYTVHDGALHIAVKDEGPSRWARIDDVRAYAPDAEASPPDAAAALEPLTEALLLAAQLKREAVRLAGGDEALAADALALASLERLASLEFGGVAGLLLAMNLGKMAR